MDEKAEKAIKYAKDLLDLYKYGTPLKFGEDENEMLKILLMVIEGKDCVIETQAHNEEVLMEYFNRNTCLHCGKGKPAYCEDCYQELIATNAELQKERDGIYEDYQDLGKEKLKLEEKVEELGKDYYSLRATNIELLRERDRIMLHKPECTDKDWMTCRVEKRGCEGCHYDIEAKKKRGEIQ